MRSQFAWAIPDERALRILGHFSPIIEIGAGFGYWVGISVRNIHAFVSILMKFNELIATFIYECSPDFTFGYRQISLGLTKCEVGLTRECSNLYM